MEPAKILIMLVGLPRSGKTTWALKQECPIVNPDAIRLALHGQAFIGDAEPMVWAIAKYMVKALFLAGHEKVILDACNNTCKRRDPWESESWVREFVVFATPKETCLRRVSVMSVLGTQCGLERLTGGEHELDRAQRPARR